MNSDIISRLDRIVELLENVRRDEPAVDQDLLNKLREAQERAWLDVPLTAIHLGVSAC